MTITTPPGSYRRVPCALVLEDSPSGVSAAIAAGMKVVAIHEGNAGKYDIAHAHLELASLIDFNWSEILETFNLGSP